MTVELPEIGDYNTVAAYLKLARKTLYRMTSQGEFRRGIYLGRGRFNLAKLKMCIEKYGTYLNHGAR